MFTYFGNYLNYILNLDLLENENILCFCTCFRFNRVKFWHDIKEEFSFDKLSL